MSAEVKNYGSAQAEEGGRDQSDYDIDNTFYVKEREMSRQEKCTKLMLVLLPIVLALLLVGGFTFYVISHVLVRGGGSKHGDLAYPPAAPSPAASGHKPQSRPGHYPAESPPSSTPKEKSVETSGSSACSDNAKCAKLGLIGECCPTKQGVKLGCCN